jgi:probable addiction module antidote protein
MPKRTTDFRADLLEDLADPREAAHYLNAALDDSEQIALVALRDIAEARQMSRVAGEAGVSREALYRMLRRTGNPTYSSLMGILGALGLRIMFAPAESTVDPIVGPSSPHQIDSGRAKTGNLGTAGSAAILQSIPDTNSLNGVVGNIPRKQPTIEQLRHAGSALCGAASVGTSLYA